MASGDKKFSDFGWPLIVILFVIGAWPIALGLLLFKLFSSDDKKTKSQSGTTQASRAQQTVRKVTKSPAEKRSTARWLKIIGGIFAFVGLFACVEPIDMMIWLQEIDSYYVEDLLVALAMFVGGGAMFLKGVSMSRSLKRYAKYLAVMGDREAVSVEELARTLGYSARRVEKDLHAMIDKGYFGGQAYLNVELGHLFRGGKASEDLHRQQQAQQKEQAEAQAAKESENDYSAILRNIRRANDRIADPVLSAKIDRLEEITAKIFKAVEDDPKKRSRIDTFLNYYLPTTQKLLDSYAEFEAAGVEGENLRQAKSRIESTMDSIVRGFEHQLDQLYKADAMDVDSDIRVMEQMLHRDTASVERDFDLGAAAAQQAEEQ